MPAELYNRLARDGPVEALEAEFKLGSAPVVPSELCCGDIIHRGRFGDPRVGVTLAGFGTNAFVPLRNNCINFPHPPCAFLADTPPVLGSSTRL